MKQTQARSLRFTKMHGAGNDFVVIDATRAPFLPCAELLDALTDRRFGVGCDQVLVVEAPSSGDVDFNYRIFNSDGSEVGQCGNGARCLARFVREQGLSVKDAIRVRTATSIIEMQHLADGRVRVNMGVPKLEPSDVPVTMLARALRYSLPLHSGELIEFGAVSMGNPHAVLAVNDVDTAPVAEVGAELQGHPAFPQRVNVGFLQVLDRSHARLRVYERGAGETLACGSGACAAAVIGRLWGLLDARTDLQVLGGVLSTEWQGENQPVFLTGPAQTVFQGEIEWPRSAR
jgi:diaminopimelate epimerase